MNALFSFSLKIVVCNKLPAVAAEGRGARLAWAAEQTERWEHRTERGEEAPIRK